MDKSETSEPLLHDRGLTKNISDSKDQDDSSPESSVLGDEWEEQSFKVVDRAQTGYQSKLIWSSVLLVLVLASFTVQTEVTMFISQTGWKQSWCMLYFVHSTITIIWPILLIVLRLQQRHVPWPEFWRRHCLFLRETAQMIRYQKVDIPAHFGRESPVVHMVKITALVTTVMTFGAITWFVGARLTTASDLTAIYNCSAFFAYAFSVLLLKEKPSALKNVSVALAIFGIFIVAYGDTILQGTTESTGAQKRTLGNIVVGVGAILVGLHEVVYKKCASPPPGTSNERSVIFAYSFASMMGLMTIFVLWIPIPILHFTGIEIFELPSPKVALLLFVSGLCAAIFSGSFLGLMSLTSPVLGAVASLLTIFTVAFVDWLRTGEGLSIATLFGSFLIMLAFSFLAYSTLQEERSHADHPGMEMQRMPVH